MSRGTFQAAIDLLCETTNPPPNKTQQERMLLLRAECYLALGRYERSLLDAQQATSISKGSSPQSKFAEGRAQLALQRLDVARQAFDEAEILMSAGESVPPENLAAAWAEIGVNPRNPGATAPQLPNRKPNSRVVTLDWSNDLRIWRGEAELAKQLEKAVEQKVVPRPLLQRFVAFAKGHVASVAGRSGSVVVVIQNCTPRIFHVVESRLTGATEYCPPLAMPTEIQPMSCAVVGILSRKWLSGVYHAVTLELDAGTKLHLVNECPLISSYRCGVGFQSLTATTGGSSKMCLQDSSGRFRVSTTQPCDVQFVSVMPCRSSRTLVPMSALAIASVLDFLPAVHLRRAAAMDQRWRRAVNTMPPSRFIPLASPFPGFCCGCDLEGTPWTVGEAATWRVSMQLLPANQLECSFYDPMDRRILMVATDDVYASHLSQVCYATSSQKQLVLSAGFFGSSAEVLTPVSRRRVGVLSYVEKTGCKLAMLDPRLGKKSSAQPAVVLSTLQSPLKSCDVVNGSGEKVAKWTLSSRRRSGTGTLDMQPGVDALLLACLLFYGFCEEMRRNP